VAPVAPPRRLALIRNSEPQLFGTKAIFLL
jgi:hypothetical protein